MVSAKYSQRSHTLLGVTFSLVMTSTIGLDEVVLVSR
jgi:hypothetical protein